MRMFYIMRMCCHPIAVGSAWPVAVYLLSHREYFKCRRRRTSPLYEGDRVQFNFN
jgi:hypothetical protein